MSDALIVIGAVIVVYALVAERLGRTVVTGPMVFTAAGVLIGPEGFDLVDLELDNSTVESLLTTTLAVVLFVDAAHIDIRALRRGATTPTRLLLIGFPLMLIVGSFAGLGIFPGLGTLAAVGLSTVLAPTDAALGQAVVTNRKVPLGVRQSLSVESGLNDGLALPVLFTVLAIHLAEEATDTWEVLLREFGREVGWGVAAGLGVGLMASAAIRLARRAGLAPSPDAVAVASIGALAATVGVAQASGGSMLIGSFVCGLVTGPAVRTFGDGAFRFGEDLAEVLTLLAFVVFGGVILSDELGTLNWQIALYAVLSLAVIRPLSVAVSLIGTGDRTPTVLFIGWFGPRGLASILFVATIEQQAPTFDSLDLITSVMTWTVLASILAHGLSAWPASNRYADFCELGAVDMKGSMRPLPLDSIMPRRGVLRTRGSPH